MAEQSTGEGLESGMTYPLAFFSLAYDSKTSNAVGCIFVTDNTGIPLEFRITTAVRPTDPQRILYGKRLYSFVCEELIAPQLISSLVNKPRVVFVESEELLGIYQSTDIPVLQLTSHKTGESVAMSVKAPEKRPQYERAIDIVSLHPDMADAFQRVEQCRELLAEENADHRL